MSPFCFWGYKVIVRRPVPENGQNILDKNKPIISLSQMNVADTGKHCQKSNCHTII